MRTTPVPVVAVALWLAMAVSPAVAQEADRGRSLRMGDTAILGERPTPDVFFIVPTGKPGGLRAPHRRDYSAEILEPVVKPWLEKEQHLTLADVQRVSGDAGDWEEAFSSPPPRAPRHAPEPVLAPRRPALAIPAAALSRPEPPPSPLPAAAAPARVVVPPPSLPSVATSSVPAPRPAAPAPPPGADGGVPILVPPP